MADGVRHVVVVLSWNGRDDTLACVESLVTGSGETTVLVIDNGSHDGVLEAVERRFPGVLTQQNGENLGFAGGMNSGIRTALDLGAEWITVLNNDTVVAPGVMAVMRSTAGADGVASPEIYFRDEPDRLWFGGAAMDAGDAYPHHLAASELQPCAGGIRITQLMAGCCVTASRAVWLKVGMFDERYFLNFEDSEWSIRAARLGVELRNGLLFNRTAGGTFRSRLRFVRRHVLAGIRSQRARDRVRTGIVVLWGVGAYALRRFGSAPRPLQALARRWNR
jgi:GT2 family glycosyltransferase